jgi:anaerobic C4-dicarboxylate transporter
VIVRYSGCRACQSGLIAPVRFESTGSNREGEVYSGSWVLAGVLACISSTFFGVVLLCPLCNGLKNL